MTRNILRNIGSEEWKVFVFMLITAVIDIATTFMMNVQVSPYMIPVVTAGTVLMALIVICIIIYYNRVKKVKPEPQDERTALCSLKSSRNAFLTTLALLAVYMILGQLGAPLLKIMALQSIWLIAVVAYLVSYLHYKRVE